MSSSQHAPVDPQVLAALRGRLSPGAECLSLADFIDCALYHPVAGYYRRPGQRVGRGAGTDFYTASSLGGVFSRLVLAAIRDLLPPGARLEDFAFVEFGPESPGGTMAGLAEAPFREVLLVRPGEPFALPPQAIVFSNELFDAQPFRRFVRAGGRWLEAGVRMAGEHLEWTLMEPGPPLPELPSDAPEHYIIDWPAGAHALLEQICREPWNGLLLACDYGLDRSTVFTERPAGTGRTYAAHRTGDNLLENPGHTDITCHLIWDELEAILAATGFTGIRVQRQEAFFLRHGQTVLKEVLSSRAERFSREKQTLLELLHPGNMGHKFQVLSAVRGDF